MGLPILAEEEDVRENFPSVLGCAVVPVVVFSIDEDIPVEPVEPEAETARGLKGGDSVDRPEAGVTLLSAPSSTLPEFSPVTMTLSLPMPSALVADDVMTSFLRFVLTYIIVVFYLCFMLLSLLLIVYLLYLGLDQGVV